MTIDQGLAFSILLVMMAAFIWGRIRYDLVALLALLISVAFGLVPPEEAFSGFSDDIVIIIAAALVLSAAVARSGVVESLLRRVGPYLTSTQMMIIVLVGSVTLLSAFVKNIGALAMLMPVAFQIARRTNTSPSYLLMPMAFGSLLGGLMTLIGTSPNVIVSRMRTELVGEPFRMFDFLPVGAVIAAAGLGFLAFGYRLLPGARRGTASLDTAFNIKGYVTEAVLSADSPMVGQKVVDLEALSEGDVHVTTIIRERFRRYTPTPDWTLLAEDVLLLEGEPAALERLVGTAKLRLAGAEEAGDIGQKDTDTVGVVEAVITADSPLIDRTPANARLSERFQINLLAVSRSGERVTHRLRTIRFRAGDVVVLQGDMEQMPDVLGELRCLPLAERDIRLGSGRRSLIPAIVLLVTMLILGFQLVPVALAFFTASVLVVLFRSLTMKEAYEVIDWPILILIGALIPVSEAMRTTGATDIISGWLSLLAGGMSGPGAIALIIVAAMAVTPFLNNAATVLVMAPIAAGLATDLGYHPDAFLMAVAVGAACDFLTPIGHQCNTLVMGPGGYRFGDYWRLGLPLSIIVVLIGTPMISWVWPLSSP